MHDIRAGKIIAAAVLVGSGSICVTIGEARGGLRFFVGVVLLVAGFVFLVGNWFGKD